MCTRRSSWTHNVLAQALCECHVDVRVFAPLMLLLRPISLFTSSDENHREGISWHVDAVGDTKAKEGLISNPR